METLDNVLSMTCAIYDKSTAFKWSEMEAPSNFEPNWCVRKLVTDWPNYMYENLSCVEVHVQRHGAMPAENMCVLIKFVFVNPPQPSFIWPNPSCYFSICCYVFVVFLPLILSEHWFEVSFNDFKHHITWQLYIKCYIAPTSQKSSFSNEDLRL